MLQPSLSLLKLQPNRSCAMSKCVVLSLIIASEASIRTVTVGKSKNVLFVLHMYECVIRLAYECIYITSSNRSPLVFHHRMCGLCLPQCCFKNKGNCPRNMDNAQCNTSPVPIPSPPTPPPVNRRPGSNYCTYSPDYACYPNTSGKPGCCWDDDGEYCPPQKPGCHQQQQPVVGSDYCTYGFDYECYPGTGKPACCLQDGGRNCPNQQPPCQQQQRLGSNYCTFGFDYSCYPQFGKPQCCFQDGGEFCPPERETCAPTPMPTNQQPPPKGKGKTNAPTFRPTTAGPPGQNVCTWTPDHACFPNSNGRPPCCESPQGCHVGSSTECEPRGKKNLRFKAMKGSEN